MAIIIEGRKIAASMRVEIKEKVTCLKERGVVPKLAVILVGDDPASLVYARSKEESCKKLGVDYELHVRPGAVSEDEVIALIDRLNKEDNTHGIMIELPLPRSIDKQKVLESVSPVKDVDGVHPVNRGYILSGVDGLFPATPLSCIEIMLRNGFEITGKHAVLVGRGETVGKPLIFMMLNQNATVTVCHTRTKNLPYHTRQADILIAAVGKARMITAGMIKPGAVVIDAGINEAEGGGLCGDVDFENAVKVAGAITPVPGGVGSLTTVMIQKNLLKAIQLQGRRPYSTR